MNTLCSDGKMTNYFIKKIDNLNYTYKDISAFDLNTQKRIWVYNFPKSAITYSLLKGDSLFFSTWIDKIANLVCYNIDKQAVVWKKTID
jgi:hypothetical protein